MKRKALRVRSEGSIPPYVTEAESRKQHSDSPLCNSLKRAERLSTNYLSAQYQVVSSAYSLLVYLGELVIRIGQFAHFAKIFAKSTCQFKKFPYLCPTKI